MRRISILSTTLCLLSACGTAPGGGNAAGEAGGSASAGSATPPASWNAVDACAVLDKDVYGALIGRKVASTTLGLVSESDGTTAATSECTYMLDGDERMTVMLRWSPINDNSEGAINTTRSTLSQTVKAFGKTVETLEGVGKAAFWVDITGSLNVFIGEDKFAIINVPSGADAKAKAVAVARKLGA